MTVEEAMEVVRRGHLEAVYVLAGPNRFWARVWLDAARERMLGADNQTGLVRMDNALDFKTVELELASVGFFQESKVVVVENPRWPKKDEVVSRYAASPIPGTLLVILEEKAQPGLAKALGNHRYVELKNLSPGSFKRFVEEESRRQGVTFIKDGLETFCRLASGNESHAIQELAKLSLAGMNPWDGRTVSETVLPLPSDEPLWDVTDAFLARDIKKSMARLHHHLGRGVPPLVLFIMMARQLIQIDRAKRAQAQGIPVSLFQKNEGLKDFVAKKIWGAAKRWPDPKIAELMEWAGKIDLALKTGYGEPDVWVLMWTALAG
ncbi:DNA polymerase III subunit delta [Sulfobacillus harzensis]|uniref:DNA-directed DNA polymerase n=1 Tax=Sulfobacillus harzensis TaxID=2729629 RepID=A0A7Y0L1V2_9FIRM|nr:DNA polymerase III subunit delta [Sulfobacillus harzensis]NMP21206.1 DNA polymerase III subunit delta [Sulfobacillus harzensis]